MYSTNIHYFRFRIDSSNITFNPFSYIFIHITILKTLIVGAVATLLA